MQFHGYGLIIGLAVVTGWWWAGKRAEKAGIGQGLVEKAALWVIILGGVGARIYHVVDYWDYYAPNWERILWIWQGGLGIWGAIVGGMVGGLIWSRGRINKLVKLLDVAAAAMPLAQAIGRWGNWVNGELYGKSGQPLFAYESMLNLILFGVINFRIKFTKPGQVLGVYLVGYGLIRVGLEPLRLEPWSISEIPVAILFSGGAIIIGGILLIGGTWKKNIG